MSLYLLGLLTLPALLVLGVYARDTGHLWRSVRARGGEDERVLTRGGRLTQRVLRAIARLAGLLPERRSP